MEAGVQICMLPGFTTLPMWVGSSSGVLQGAPQAPQQKHPQQHKKIWTTKGCVLASSSSEAAPMRMFCTFHCSLHNANR